MASSKKACRPLSAALVLVLCLASLAVRQAVAECTSFQWTSQGPGDQLVALQEFYLATQGQQWSSQSGWDMSAAASDGNACIWQGITCCNVTEISGNDGEDSPPCTYDGSVQFVTLPYNNLHGQIPASFWTQLGCTLSGVSLAGNDYYLLLLGPCQASKFSMLPDWLQLSGARQSNDLIGQCQCSVVMQASQCILFASFQYLQHVILMYAGYTCVPSGTSLWLDYRLHDKRLTAC